MITRREGLAWLAAATGMIPITARAQGAMTAWPTASISPVSGPGYGSDPDLMDPKAPWPLTLDAGQRALVTVLCDLILPADDTSPGAGEAGVADFIDEWVSAPYPTQSSDRDQTLRGLAWLDTQAGAGGFVATPVAGQTAILDGLAAGDTSLSQPSAFFHRLRTLIVLGFYTMPVGKAAMGYIGNQPVHGDYPGPTPEAMDHFHALLARLNLKDPGQPWQVD